MKHKLFVAASLFFSLSISAQNPDEQFIRKIADEILTNGKAYDNLRTLTKTIGARLAGSPQMYKAEAWGTGYYSNRGAIMW
ncbi:hypothetical protein LWM68_00810 [Niabella sp. W65]|nr:hypothetical protein [Niabella sp. W65]MCH7361448.1 hypothetical protein [Niabella sp. W65]